MAPASETSTYRVTQGRLTKANRDGEGNPIEPDQGRFLTFEEGDEVELNAHQAEAFADRIVPADEASDEDGGPDVVSRRRLEKVEEKAAQEAERRKEVESELARLRAQVEEMEAGPLDGVDLTSAAQERAEAAGLTAEDFEAAGDLPTTDSGRYGVDAVEAVLAAQQEGEGGDDEGDGES